MYSQNIACLNIRPSLDLHDCRGSVSNGSKDKLKVQGSKIISVLSGHDMIMILMNPFPDS